MNHELTRLEERRDALIRLLRTERSWSERMKLNLALDAVCDELEKYPKYQ